ncbi:MAG: hypothetical protein ABFE07_18755 [Armatimonadia bacterium]
MVYKKRNTEEAKKKPAPAVQPAPKAVVQPVGPDRCPECDAECVGHAGCNHKSCPQCGWGK